jgi:SAM-dependent methyltransferase
MTDTFREYAQCYDLIYKDKEYRREAEFAASLLARVLGKPPSETRVLDLACGTGRHAQELVRMGFHVEGADMSADMVSVARERSADLGLAISFHNESFQTCNRLEGEFDGVIAMFAAIDYLTQHADFAQSLRNIRGLLRRRGVFLFDFWNGNAVLKMFSPTRVKKVVDGDLALVRTSNTSLDRISQVATVNFHFSLSSSGHLVREFSEVHRVRYFFPQEMTDLLLACGFEVVHRCPFLKADAPIEPEEWNLTYVARPCG